MKVSKVTDDEIKKEFGDNFKSFPVQERRKIIAECILKIFRGYADSAILMQIITSMGLISKKRTILKRGKEYLYDYYICINK